MTSTRHRHKPSRAFRGWINQGKPVTTPNINRSLRTIPPPYERYHIRWAPCFTIFWPPGTDYAEATRTLANRFSAWVWVSPTCTEVTV